MTIGGYSKKDPIKGKRYVVCSTAKRGCGCTFVQWNMAHLEPLLLNYLRELDVADLLKENEENQTLAGLRREQGTTAGEVADIERRLKLIMEAIEAGGNIATFVKRAAELEMALHEKEARLKDLRHQIAIEESTEQGLAEHIKQLIHTIYLYHPGGVDAEYHHDEKGNPTHAELRSIDRTSRLALIWFRAGDLARQVVENREHGRTDSFDLEIPAARFVHMERQAKRK